LLSATNTLVEDYEFVSQFDPAVDRTAEDFELKWKQHLDGIAEVPLKPNAKPAKFRLRHLDDVDRKILRKMLSAGDGDVTQELLDAAAALAIIGFTDADGKELRLSFSTERYALFEATHVSGDSIRAMKLPDNALTDVGGAVLARTFTRPS
jgi:hypothetical protein